MDRFSISVAILALTLCPSALAQDKSLPEDIPLQGDIGTTQTRAVSAVLVREDRAMRLEWASQEGVHYQVQASQDVSNWANVGPVRRGTGQRMRAPVGVSGGRRYMRVIRTEDKPRPLPPTPLKLLKALAKKGDAHSQFKLGVMHYLGGRVFGEDVLKDNKKAVKWYRKAAEQNHSGAQFNLGVMYQFGEGVLEDDVMAYAWYNIAAANDNAIAEENKGIIAKEMTAKQIAKANNMGCTKLWPVKHAAPGSPAPFRQLER